MKKFDIDLIRTYDNSNDFTWSMLVYARYSNKFNYRGG